TVSIGIALVTIAYRLVHFVAMTPQAPLGLTLIQMGMSILFYPVMVLIAALTFGITRPAPGDPDGNGARIW
ncbi:MAG: hypothetical protein JJT81_04540, partial [Rubellimicrobium sp.]|nr:hypothetical protein [Rubellimicrobium sp.]